MTFWLIVQILYYYYATGDWWEWRVLSQVHVQFPSNRSTISMRYSVLTTCREAIHALVTNNSAVQIFIQD